MHVFRTLLKSSKWILMTLCICVVQARGAAIPQLIELTKHYGIYSIGITDKDDSDNPPSLPNHFETTLRDFEEEIISLIDNGRKTS